MRRLIFTAASGWYAGYVPLFEFCAKRTYPDVDVKVHIVNHLPSPLAAACYRLLAGGQGGENPCDWASEYDRVYITDVDIFHVPCTPTLWEYHEARMQATGLPFSNSPRGKEPHGRDRLTGLHYCTPEWYKRTSGLRFKALYDLATGRIGGKRFDDELMLMRIAKAAGFPVPPKEVLVPRHFGIHMGSLRCYATHNRPQRDAALRKRITPKMAQLWNETIDSPGFAEAARESCRGCPQIAQQLERAELFCRKTSLTKTDKYFLRYKA